MSSKQELKNILQQTLTEHEVSKEDIHSILERMSAFLDIVSENKFTLSVPKDPTTEDISKLITTISSEIHELTNKLVFERLCAESFYVKGD